MKAYSGMEYYRFYRGLHHLDGRVDQQTPGEFLRLLIEIWKELKQHFRTWVYVRVKIIDHERTHFIDFDDSQDLADQPHDIVDEDEGEDDGGIVCIDSW